MGIIFLYILIVITITILCYTGTDSNYKNVKWSNALAGFLFASAIVSVITIAILLSSYNTYVGLVQKLNTIEQYSESIKLYTSKGISEFSGPSAKGEITDLKYNNYQTQIGQMISDMRDVIVEYNKDLTKKKMRKNNWFFSWVMITDDNLKLIKMSDYIK